MVAEECNVDLPSSTSLSNSGPTCAECSMFGLSNALKVPSLIFKTFRSFLQSHELDRRLKIRENSSENLNRNEMMQKQLMELYE